MKCDDFLTDLETGGPFKRWRARRHAANCPRCAAMLTTFRSAMQEFSNPEPLAPEMRQRWESVAEIAQPVVRPRTARQSTSWTVAIATAACVLLMIYVVNRPDPEIGSGPPVAGSQRDSTSSSITVSSIDTGEQIAQLSRAVDQLELNLASIRTLAERHDAQRQLHSLIGEFERW